MRWSLLCLVMLGLLSLGCDGNTADDDDDDTGLDDDDDDDDDDSAGDDDTSGDDDSAGPHADFRFAPATLEFGEVCNGSASVIALSMWNAGDAQMAINGMAVGAPVFTFQEYVGPLMPGGQPVDVDITATCDQAGAVNSAINVVTDIPEFGTVAVPARVQCVGC